MVRFTYWVDGNAKGFTDFSNLDETQWFSLFDLHKYAQQDPGDTVDGLASAIRSYSLPTFLSILVCRIQYENVIISKFTFLQQIYMLSIVYKMVLVFDLCWLCRVVKFPKSYS